MAATTPGPTALTARDQAVAALEASWERLEAAAAARDYDTLASEVAAREPLIVRLRGALAQAPLPEEEGRRLAAREAATQDRIQKLYATLGDRLHDTQRRGQAARRYRDAPR